MIVPAIQLARESASKVVCQSNMRQIATALQLNHQDNNRLPPLPARGANDPNRVLGWQALILPYVEQDALYQESIRACQTSPNPLVNPPHIGLSKVIDVYICGSDSRLSQPHMNQTGNLAGFTSYIGIAGTIVQGERRGHYGALGDSPGRTLGQIRDGLSQTLMFGERPPPDNFLAGWWYPNYFYSMSTKVGPNNCLLLGAMDEYALDAGCTRPRLFGPGYLSNPCDRFHLWSLHPGGAFFAYADASVRFHRYAFEEVIIQMGSINGG